MWRDKEKSRRHPGASIAASRSHHRSTSRHSSNPSSLHQNSSFISASSSSFFAYSSSLIFAVLCVIAFTGVSSSSVPLPKGAYDLLSAVNIQSFPYGVKETVGICTNRPPYVTDSNGYPVGKPDVAYRLNEDAQLSVTTNTVFPDGFPQDFSILATIRPDDQNSAFLFTIYNGQNGNEELAIQVGPRPLFWYEDVNGRPGRENSPRFNNINLSDGKWHRVAFSVKGDSVTMLLDCKENQTLPLKRSNPSNIDLTGIIIVGRQLMEDAVFKGDIQDLIIVDNPEAAYSHCTCLSPDCQVPFDTAEKSCKSGFGKGVVTQFDGHRGSSRGSRSRLSRSEANARLNEEAGGYGFGSFGDEAVSSVGEGAFGAAGGEIGLAPSLSGGDYE